MWTASFHARCKAIGAKPAIVSWYGWRLISVSRNPCYRLQVIKSHPNVQGVGSPPHHCFRTSKTIRSRTERYSIRLTLRLVGSLFGPLPFRFQNSLHLAQYHLIPCLKGLAIRDSCVLGQQVCTGSWSKVDCTTRSRSQISRTSSWFEQMDDLFYHVFRRCNLRSPSNSGDPAYLDRARALLSLSPVFRRATIRFLR